MESVEPVGEPETTHELWKTLFDRLQAVLGNNDYYWTADPLEEPKMQLGGSLADDLADIYLEMKINLNLLAEGASENEIVWDWRFGFWNHWGAHAVEALRVIHAQLAAMGGLPAEQSVD